MVLVILSGPVVSLLVMLVGIVFRRLTVLNVVSLVDFAKVTLTVTAFAVVFDGW
jgi:hypothetical protein